MNKPTSKTQERKAGKHERVKELLKNLTNLQPSQTLNLDFLKE